MKSRAALLKMTKDELVDELKNLENTLKAAPVLTPTAVTESVKRAGDVLEKAKSFSADTIVANGAKFGLEVQRVIAGLTEQSTAKAAELAVLNEAIAVQTTELERLYNIEVVAANLQAMVQDFAARHENLSKQIEEQQNRWDVEQEEHEKQLTEEADEAKATRRREQADYDYRIKRDRERDQSDYEYRKAQQERDLADQRTAFDKDIAEQRAEVEAQKFDNKSEAERLVKLEADLESSTVGKVNAAVNAAKKEQQHLFQLEKKDLENQNAIVQQKLVDAQAQNQRQIVEITQLREELARARTEVKEVATKAFEAQSGQLALSKVMEASATTNGGKSKTS